MVVRVSGPLGAGKTAFVRGLAQGLGCDPSDVSSPTFTIIQEYPGATRLQHVDLYRLSPAEVRDLALDDLLDDAVMAVEWPDRWLDAPAESIDVVIEVVGEGERRIVIGHE
jgi:tRNA threonylcarbamoyladenosine biosynthesis protein TsaE